MTVLTNLLDVSLSSLVPLLLVAVAAVMAERSGATNIALDGCTLLGALGAVSTAAATGSASLGIVGGLLCGMLYAALLAVATFALRIQIYVAGIALNILASGLALLVLQLVLGAPGTYAPAGVPLIPRIDIGPLASIPVLGPALDDQSSLLYVAVAATVLVWLVLARSRFGLHVRAVGEAPEAARAAGISPIRVQTAAIVVSGIGSGLGGAYLSLSSVAAFNSQTTSGLGFIAFAAVIFGGARVRGTVVACLLFAVALGASIQFQSPNVDTRLLHSLPYVATVAALLFQALGRGGSAAGRSPARSLTTRSRRRGLAR